MPYSSPSDSPNLAGYPAANMMERLFVTFRTMMLIISILFFCIEGGIYVFGNETQSKAAAKTLPPVIGAVLLIYVTPTLFNIAYKLISGEFTFPTIHLQQWFPLIGTIGVLVGIVAICVFAGSRKDNISANNKQNAKASKPQMSVQKPSPQTPISAKPVSPEDETQNWIREIREVNEAIPDKVLSRKIDRVEEITAEILKQQKKRPAKAAELRKFLNYYLPTTLKLLKEYAELDKVTLQGEYIQVSKKRIEGMMDKVVKGFERQLNKLFKDQMLDISSDVTVLEHMLQADGLTDDGQMPKTDSQ